MRTPRFWFGVRKLKNIFSQNRNLGRQKNKIWTGERVTGPYFWFQISNPDLKSGVKHGVNIPFDTICTTTNCTRWLCFAIFDTIIFWEKQVGPGVWILPRWCSDVWLCWCGTGKWIDCVLLVCCCVLIILFTDEFTRNTTLLISGYREVDVRGEELGKGWGGEKLSREGSGVERRESEWIG